MISNTIASQCVFFDKDAVQNGFGMGGLKLGEARKAIRAFHKASGSIPGTAELLMTYGESGVRFTHEYGDIDERFYSSMESALDELAALLRGEARELYPTFSDRLAKIEMMTEGIGWGFHDFIADVVGQLEDELGSEDGTADGTTSTGKMGSKKGANS